MVTLLICLVLSCALNAANGAGNPPAKSETLSQATHVVIGTVRNLYTKKFGGGADEALYTRSLLEIDVLEVEKGRGLPVGNVHYVANTRMVRQGKVIGQFPNTPPTPAEGDTVRQLLRYHPRIDGTFGFLDHPRAAQILKHAKDKLVNCW